MINYTSGPITILNMKAIRRMTSEELNSQSEAGQTNRQTNKPKNYMPP